MEKVILDTIEKYNLFDTYSTVVAAVSGGADSMMLLHVLSRIPQYGLKVIVAHVNHRKREDSWKDEHLVKETAIRLKLPYHVHYLEAVPPSGNFQAYAREKRYEFFLGVAKAHGASYIATAHHGDDHLETVIQRLIHHQSASGLQGIRPSSGFHDIRLVRPLIMLQKSDVYRYCLQEGIPYREDTTNQSLDYSRNRIRQNILPQLHKESPKLLQHVRRLSDGLAEDEAYFKEEIERLMATIIFEEDGASFSRSWMRALPQAISRRLVKRLFQELGAMDLTSAHIQDLLDQIISTTPNSGYFLPGGYRLAAAYDKVQFLTKPPMSAPYSLQLAENSSVVLPTGDKLTIYCHNQQRIEEKNCINKVHLCYNEIDLPLQVRTRQNGDRIVLKNGGGTKKIKEIMIEAKVPRQERDTWPVITDASGRILWLPLLKTTDMCKNTASKDLITLEYIRHGGN